MNYRHIYHAGNFADIFKHLILHMVLGYMQQKEKGLFVLDAFAGLGLYDLSSIEASKTGEFREGVARIMAQPAQNPDIKTFQDIIAPNWAQQNYAGSPVLAAQMLRPQDRLVANELHPDDNPVLAHNLRGFSNTRVTMMDAYESIRANIPPAEKRGLVLIDPPFEKPDEFALLVKQMQEWKKRWATGCYIIWYPIKAGGQVQQLHKAAVDIGFHRTWVSEYLLQKRDMAGGLNGCGLLICNTPFGIPERVAALSPELSKLLGSGWVESRLLVGD
jgi:23S rRNA (adenine2030-N6)-methyltransferase